MHFTFITNNNNILFNSKNTIQFYNSILQFTIGVCNITQFLIQSEIAEMKNDIKELKNDERVVYDFEEEEQNWWFN
jgi:hypothetical protein